MATLGQTPDESFTLLNLDSVGQLDNPSDSVKIEEERQLDYLICKVCNGSFTSNADLINHCRTHKIKLEHICVICGRDYERKWDLFNHMQVHADVLEEYHRIFFEKVKSLRIQIQETNLDGNIIFKEPIVEEEIKTVLEPVNLNSDVKIEFCSYEVKDDNEVDDDEEDDDMDDRDQAKVESDNPNEIKMEYHGDSQLDPIKDEDDSNDDKPIGKYYTEQMDDQRSDSGNTTGKDIVIKKKKSKKHRRLKKKSRHKKSKKKYDENALFKCKHCSFRTNSQRDFTKHCKTVCKEKIMGSCDQCDYFTRVIGELAMHKLTHEPGELYECEDCTYKTRSSKDYELHRKYHLQRAVFCYICNKTFRGASYLKEHMLKHSNERRFQCNLCPSKFKEEKTCRNHMLDRHGIVIPRPEKKTLPTIVDSEGIKYKCEDCDYKTKYRGSLRKHFFVHQEKGFFCDICGKAFRYISHLKEHLRSHSQERVFKCSKCPQAYKDGKSLKRHFIKVHDTARAVKCQMCGFIADSEAYLKRHERKHSSENVYRCDQCPFTCRTSLTLKRHVHIDTDLPMYTCPQCDYKDVSEKGIKLHLKRHREDLSVVASPLSNSMSSL